MSMFLTLDQRDHADGVCSPTNCEECDYEWEKTHDIAICGGCGAYGALGDVHNRRVSGEWTECGEFV